MLFIICCMFIVYNIHERLTVGGVGYLVLFVEGKDPAEPKTTTQVTTPQRLPNKIN